jgi:hypothetical protein
MFSVLTHTAVATSSEVFSTNDNPFGRAYSEWVIDWWKWWITNVQDAETEKLAGLQENGCLLHHQGAVVMLLDTAVGGSINQKCKISSEQGILIPIWTGECDQATQGHFDDSFKQLTECAREYDVGRVTGQVNIDGKQVARLSATDLKTHYSQNVSEINTPQFNATFKEGGVMDVVRFGTFPTVAHGWFVFLKPLSPGQHSVYYENNVLPTTRSGAETQNSARINYSFVVE